MVIYVPVSELVVQLKALGVYERACDEELVCRLWWAVVGGTIITGGILAMEGH